MEVLEMGDNGPIVANPDDCSGCRTCESNCESDAIKVEETE
jgi:NAD-dependent dihydropyrimidine dehydrogenase PreA subunit